MDNEKQVFDNFIKKSITKNYDFSLGYHEWVLCNNKNDIFEYLVRRDDQAPKGIKIIDENGHYFLTNYSGFIADSLTIKGFGEFSLYITRRNDLDNEYFTSKNETLNFADSWCRFCAFNEEKHVTTNDFYKEVFNKFDLIGQSAGMNSFHCFTSVFTGFLAFLTFPYLMNRVEIKFHNDIKTIPKTITLKELNIAMINKKTYNGCIKLST
jgi:hypothetical protein